MRRARPSLLLPGVQLDERPIAAVAHEALLDGEGDECLGGGKDTAEYTIFHPLVVEVLCGLFFAYACWLGQKQNTPNFYHKPMKDSVDSDKVIPSISSGGQNLLICVIQLQKLTSYVLLSREW